MFLSNKLFVQVKSCTPDPVKDLIQIDWVVEADLLGS